MRSRQNIENRLGSYAGLRPGIVVGVGYPDASRRNFDYTPAVPIGTELGRGMGPTGGAGPFLDFLANKVIPEVEAAHDRRRQSPNIGGI